MSKKNFYLYIYETLNDDHGVKEELHKTLTELAFEWKDANIEHFLSLTEATDGRMYLCEDGFLIHIVWYKFNSMTAEYVHLSTTNPVFLNAGLEGKPKEILKKKAQEELYDEIKKYFEKKFGMEMARWEFVEY